MIIYEDMSTEHERYLKKMLLFVQREGPVSIEQIRGYMDIGSKWDAFIKRALHPSQPKFIAEFSGGGKYSSTELGDSWLREESETKRQQTFDRAQLRFNKKMLWIAGATLGGTLMVICMTAYGIMTANDIRELREEIRSLEDRIDALEQ